jgi:hypothetical protein
MRSINQVAFFESITGQLSRVLRELADVREENRALRSLVDERTSEDEKDVDRVIRKTPAGARPSPARRGRSA